MNASRMRGLVSHSPQKQPRRLAWWAKDSAGTASGVPVWLVALLITSAIVAPADPEGKVGAAPGLNAWAHEAFELDAASARARGGVDAELHVRRIRMRLACLEVWALLAVPLACVYALDPKRCGWFPERTVVEEAPDCTGVNPCCEYVSGGTVTDMGIFFKEVCEVQACKFSAGGSMSTFEPCCDMLGQTCL